ncbi:MAG TPA: (d)CMP kinase, partial [Candidatus Omnitrophota bacterium]|nr:(d)CMP kinase [Candidatus Omnitrophota bacterium]
FYIDTGAMYRALALKSIRAGIDPNNEESLASLALQTEISLNYDTKTGRLVVLLDKEDVSEEIRRPFITEIVSYIAKIKKVREIMVALQRKMAEGKKSILEGRDIATVVFPDAYKKFFLDAAPEERVKRRYLELREKKLPIEESKVKNDIENRDKIDSTREIAPLRRSPDAIYIDTTNLTIDQVVERVIKESQDQ